MKLQINLSTGPFNVSWLYVLLVDNSYHQFDVEKEELNMLYVLGR